MRALAGVLFGQPEDPDFDVAASADADRRADAARRQLEQALQRAVPLFGGAHPLWHTVTEGVGWRVWRPSDPAWPATSAGERCVHGQLRVDRRGEVLQDMCLAPNDLVSDSIKTKHRWRDCGRYVRIWQALDGAGRTQAEPHGVLLEVGANIGACTLDLLLRTRARVVAFEPSPTNLFYLTRSLRLAARRDPSIKRRVVVYPVALGDPIAPQLVTLYSEAGNNGNTVVGQAETDAGCWRRINGTRRCADRMAPLPSRVPMLSLDGLFPRGLGPARLVKLDVQGHECKVMQGGRAAFAGSASGGPDGPEGRGLLGAIVSEEASGWLGAQCCGRRWLGHLLRLRPSWAVTCTGRGGPGAEATCAGRPSGGNVSALPASVLGAARRAPLDIDSAEGLWRVCLKHGLEHGCDCGVYPRVARGRV